jgi:hypothetical protein
MPKPSPILIADKCTLTFSAEASGKIRVTYQSWEDAKAVLPGQHIEIRRGPQGVEMRILADDRELERRADVDDVLVESAVYDLDEAPPPVPGRELVQDDRAD